MSKYTAESIKTLDAIDGIRTNPHMYIGGVDDKAYQHLLMEIISNSVDESANGYTNEIRVEINSKTQEATVIDWGRGIPNQKNSKGEEVMVSIFTQTHSGGKFDRDGYASSIGTHGLGASAVNALSSKFTAVSVRDGFYAEFNAIKGRQTAFNRRPTEEKKSYSKISFIPDQTIFKGAKWNKRNIQETLRMLSYLTINVEFIFKFDKEEFVYLSKNGLKDLLEHENKDRNVITDMVYSLGKYNGSDVEIALQYSSDYSERIYCFTNGVQNSEGGTSVTGAKSGFTIYINKVAREMGLLKDEDANLGGELIRRGMILAIHVKLYEKPEFSSQTKEKLINPSARSAGSQAMSNLKISNKDLKTIIEKALTEQKAEEAARRAREAAKKVASGGKNMNALRDLPAKLTDCSSRNGELWILEGDGAAGSAKMCRDPKTQAILPLRGKVLNTHDKELADIVKNKEIKEMIVAFGAGIHQQFNINNLRYDKIIILSDAK